MRGSRGAKIAAAVAVFGTIGCDQVTKRAATEVLEGTPVRSYLGDTIRFLYAENVGGMLSFGADLPPELRSVVFVVLSGAMLGGLALMAWRGPWSHLARLGLVVLVAGGASNWIDRVLHGRVVDFFNVGVGPVRTGVFNVADVAIFLGVGLWLVGGYRRRRAEPPVVKKFGNGGAVG